MNAPHELDWTSANQQLVVAEFGRLRALLGDGDLDAAQTRVETTRAEMPAPAAIDTLAQLFELSPFERDILLRAAGVEMDARLAALCAEASGQALIIVDMLRALGLAEQTETLKELRQRRPETAQAVLEQVCLESTILHALPEVIADAMHRSSIDIISQFMRGTRDDIRDHLLRVAPGNLRRPLQEEMSLEIPVSRSEYLDARTEFTNMVVTVLRRDGHDLASLNARALTQPLGPSANEANV